LVHALGEEEKKEMEEDGVTEGVRRRGGGI